MAAAVSVVVCTHDRVDRLAATLASLSGQEIRGVDWEVLVVDNAPGEGTAAVVKRAAGELPVELRYVPEPRPGLSIARNRGWQEAEGDVIAFLDDDVVADPAWLAELAGPYASPRVAGVGGRLLPRIRPGSGGPVDPAWLGEFRFDRGDEVCDVAWFSGANMSFRRSVLERIGGFDPQLGRMGPCLMAGDEHDVCRAIRRQPGRLRLVYNPRMLAHHGVSPGDLSDATLKKRAYCCGISTVALDRKERAPRRVRELLMRQAKQGWWAARALGTRLRGRPLSLAQQARVQEFAGYYRELLGGPARACRGCPMAPHRRVARSD